MNLRTKDFGRLNAGCALLPFDIALNTAFPAILLTHPPPRLRWRSNCACATAPQPALRQLTMLPWPDAANSVLWKQFMMCRGTGVRVYVACGGTEHAQGSLLVLWLR